MGLCSRGMFLPGGIKNPLEDILIKELQKEAEIRYIKEFSEHPSLEEINEIVGEALKKLAKVLINGK